MIRSVKDLPVFDIIEFGDYKKPEDLLAALKLANCEITEFADNSFYKVSLSRPQKVELVLLSLEDLGFSSEESDYNRSRREADVNYAKIMSAGIFLGLELCPQDTAALILMRHSSDFSEIPIIPIMIPIISETCLELPLIFKVHAYNNERKKCLGSRFVCSGTSGLERGSKCVFVRPKNI